MSKSAKQGDRRLLCCTTKCGIGIQVPDGAGVQLAKLSAVGRGLQQLERARGCRNFRCCSARRLISWELGKHRIRIVRNNTGDSPGAFNVACGVGRFLRFTVECPEGSLSHTSTSVLHVCCYRLSTISRVAKTIPHREVVTGVLCGLGRIPK